MTDKSSVSQSVSRRPRVTVVISPRRDESLEAMLARQIELFPETRPEIVQADDRWHIVRDVLPGEEWMYADEIKDQRGRVIL